MKIKQLLFIDLERVGFGEILPEVKLFPEGLCPEENSITEGNISPNPPSEGSINDFIIWQAFVLMNRAI
jgi:hypothetical protein